MVDEDKEMKYAPFKSMLEESLAIGCLMGLFCILAPIDIIRGTYHKTREKLSRALHPLPENAKRIIGSYQGEAVYSIENEKYLITQLMHKDLSIERRIIGKLVKEGKIYRSYIAGSDELPFSRHTDGYSCRYYDFIPLTEEEKNSEKIRELESSLDKNK